MSSKDFQGETLSSSSDEEEGETDDDDEVFFGVAGFKDVEHNIAAVVKMDVHELRECVEHVFFRSSPQQWPSSSLHFSDDHPTVAVKDLCACIVEQEIFGEAFLALQPYELHGIVSTEAIDLFVKLRRLLEGSKGAVDLTTDGALTTTDESDVYEELRLQGDTKEQCYLQSTLLSQSSSATAYAGGWRASSSYTFPDEQNVDDPTTYGALIVLGPSEYFKSHDDDAGSEWKAIGPNNKRYVLKRKTKNIDFSSSCDVYEKRFDFFQIGSTINEFNDISVNGRLNMNDDMEMTTSVSRNACQIICSREHPYRSFASIKASLLTPSKKPTKVQVYLPSYAHWTALTPTHSQIELTHNSIIDVNGALLLFKNSVNAFEPKARLDPRKVIDHFNSIKASCPVMMSTLAFEYIRDYERERRAHLSWRKAVGKYLHEVDVDISVDDFGDVEAGDDVTKSSKASCIEPWVFAACGHVHGYSESLECSNCPLCRRASPFTPIRLPFEDEICNKCPTHVFNPCGHAASIECVQFYANVPPSSVGVDSALGDEAKLEKEFKVGTTPCCPFCGVRLTRDKPYSKLIFQSISDVCEIFPEAKRLKSPSHSPMSKIDD